MMLQDVVINSSPVVIDNGSGMIKVGFGGEKSPRYEFPSIVGRPRQPPAILSGSDQKDFYVGDEVQRKRGILKLEHPIEHGIIRDWDAIQHLWSHAFDVLDISVDNHDHSVLLTECPLNPKANRERMIEIMFEKYGVPAAYVSFEAVLSLYAAGLTTGLVMDSGDGVTRTVPVYDGYCLTHAIHRLNLGGRDITEYLGRILGERGFKFTTTADSEILREIKEKLAYVAEDYEVEQLKDEGKQEESYELPDGRVIHVSNERFRCAEVLFQPRLIGMDSSGIVHMVHDAIMECDVDIRKQLFSNILLSGGNTMLTNIESRVERGVRSLVESKSIQVAVAAPSDRKHSVWKGGAILASLPSFAPMWIQRAEYDDIGAKVVHRKCF